MFLTSSESLTRLHTEAKAREQKMEGSCSKTSQLQDKESSDAKEEELDMSVKKERVQVCALSKIRSGNIFLLMFPGKRNHHSFLSQATRIEDKETVHVSFLGQVTKRNFVWLEVEDTSPVSISDVASVISAVVLCMIGVDNVHDTILNDNVVKSGF